MIREIKEEYKKALWDHPCDICEKAIDWEIETDHEEVWWEGICCKLSYRMEPYMVGVTSDKAEEYDEDE